MVKQIETVQQVTELEVETGRLFSATHEEIKQGLTTDIYFVKTKEILQKMGRDDAEVVAEIFGRRPGVFAGLAEVKVLLDGLGLEVWSLEEGDAFQGKEVVMRIHGRYSHFGVYETAILGILASSSGWATAARAAKEAAGGKPVLCFGARHVHPAVAPVMERAAVVGGADGASCILGAKLAGLEPSGTVPHALFLIIGDTLEGAKAYHKFMPPQSTRSILVDTFKDEVEESLRLAACPETGLEAVRLDTPSERGGVTPALVQEVRARLDLAGFNHIKIFVSGGLDPERISVLAAAGADSFGVGSYISSAPAIDMTMDLKLVDGQATSKRGRIPGLAPSPRLQRVL
ncbi:MAG: nicotinate phosphoribosyltransferase [Limnochordia bacterium]|jgi:nicotinate phosphoribosyltransferase|nr:nicotinate phosphoribosyltransferase [Bacillota bacterium]NLL09101.1 nicotinate phosphoribosyltransferase [Bacillota bacterium]HBG08544.1 nicotinate phosphoribosyltransferase [Bacillota bacterium]